MTQTDHDLDEAIRRLVRDTVAEAPEPPPFEAIRAASAGTSGTARTGAGLGRRVADRRMLVAAALVTVAVTAGVLAASRLDGSDSAPATVVTTASTDTPLSPTVLPAGLVLTRATSTWEADFPQRVQRFADPAAPQRSVVVAVTAFLGPPIVGPSRPEDVTGGSLFADARWTPDPAGGGALTAVSPGGPIVARFTGYDETDARRVVGALLLRGAELLGGFDSGDPAALVLVEETFSDSHRRAVTRQQWSESGTGRSLDVTAQRAENAENARLRVASAPGATATVGGRAVNRTADTITFADGEWIVTVDPMNLTDAEMETAVSSLAELDPDEWQSRLREAAVRPGALVAEGELRVEDRVLGDRATIELREGDGQTGVVLCVRVTDEPTCAEPSSVSSMSGIMSSRSTDAGWFGAVLLGGQPYLVGSAAPGWEASVTVEVGSSSIDVPATIGDDGRRWYLVTIPLSDAAVGVNTRSLDGSGGSSGGLTIPR